MNQIEELENKLCSLNDHIVDRILAHGPLCICGHQKEYHFDHPYLFWQKYGKCCSSFCKCEKFVFQKDVEVFRCHEAKNVTNGSETL